MLLLFILNGSFIIGNVDSIEDSVAIIEYKTNNEIKYEYVNINKNICSPHEGQRVLFNNIEIISCL